MDSVDFCWKGPLAPIIEECLNVYLQGTSQGSQDSLDKHSSLPRMKSYDAAVFDVLKVPPEEFAVSINSFKLIDFALNLQSSEEYRGMA